MQGLLTLQFEKCLSLFSERVLPVPNLEHGILVSEGFALCSIFDLFKVDVILESGVCNGKSTLMLRRYFGKTVIIKAVDIKGISSSVQLSLGDIVDFKRGDSEHLFPKYIKRWSNKRIGVFIDGPKREAGVKLAKSCFAAPNVVVVGVHDMHRKEINQHEVDRGKKYNNTRRIFDKIKTSKFLTDEDWYVKKTYILDKIVKNRHTKYWTPYGYKNCDAKTRGNFGSYGFTIGFLMKVDML
ncbi:unnamed protein product [marine sediment metagenome]|uniref:Uncharacterized protein n=1 Tax=marine sediment metagenome TaxID=412755 RepID=X1AHQ6_9ZZZZ